MKLFREILIICLLGKLIACSPLASGEINDVWGHKQVATVEMAGSDSVWVCHLSMLKDTVTVPLSYFVEELEMVKLVIGMRIGIFFQNNYWQTIYFST